MITPRGSIFKLELTPVIRTVYLRRNDVLLALVEWDWTEKQPERFVFPTFDAAEEHANSLREQGHSHLHSVVERAVEPVPAIEARPAISKPGYRRRRCGMSGSHAIAEWQKAQEENS